MIEDYYKVLGLNKNCTQTQLFQSYRRLAIIWNPAHTLHDKTLAQDHFTQINEAFEVLSNPLQKAYYDKYGYESLKAKFLTFAGLNQGYHFGGTDTLTQFMDNPTTITHLVDLSIETQGSCFGSAFGGLRHRDEFRPQNIVIDVACTLEELFCGTAKDITFMRRTMSADGRGTEEIMVNKTVLIRAGTRAGETLWFEKQGHESVHLITSDLQLVMREVRKENFERKNDDIIHSRSITLADALSCKPIDILTLDGRILKLAIDHIIHPNALQQISGEGFIGEENKRGNLYIRFDIVFPNAIPQHIKTQLRPILK